MSPTASLRCGISTYSSDRSSYSTHRYGKQWKRMVFGANSAQSDVLSVTFSPFHSNLIFGGTYSGQILLWDTRSKHLPVLKTPLSAAGHTHPVYAMQMVGTQNAHK